MGHPIWLEVGVNRLLQGRLGGTGVDKIRFGNLIYRKTCAQFIDLSVFFTLARHCTRGHTAWD